jgi:hypothetical protein
MNVEQPFHFHDESALLERLSTALQRRNQEVVFLVGAPLSAPSAPGELGVPGVDGVIDLIRQEFEGDSVQLAALSQTLSDAGDNQYQAAFLFLQGRRGQHTANEIIRKAVVAARRPKPSSSGAEVILNKSLDDEDCRRLDLDGPGWALPPGIEYLGELLAHYPQRFGRSILTTNFDPLIEISIRRAGGLRWTPSFGQKIGGP